MKAGFVGLGAMGAPMAGNLARAGLLEAVWNRSPGRSRAFEADSGVPAATGLEDLARRCDVVVTCVSADADVLAVVDSLAPALGAGAIVIDCSTVAAETARRAAARLADVGAGFLDCPVSGGTEGAKAGTLSIMVGGDEAVLEKARPVLEAMGRNIVHMGPVGSGQATKATNQIMVAGINQAVTEALAFAEAQGLPLDKVIDVVGSGAAGNWFLDHRGRSMVERRFAPGFKVTLHHKDLQICQQMAQQFGVSLPVVEMTLIHYRRLMEAGFGDEDISALFRQKSALFK